MNDEFYMMSIPYYTNYRQPTQIADQEQLKQQVLDKVVLGLVVATILSVALSQIAMPVALYFVAVIAEIIIIIGVVFAKEEPTIEKLYYAFVGVTAVTLGFTLQIFGQIPGGMQMVGVAFTGTSIIVGGVYYYTSVRKPDTSKMIRYLLPVTLLLFVVFLVGIFVTFSNTIYMFLSLGAAVLFSFYLFYDLGRLMNGQYRSPSRMAFMIYWDIVLIFRYLLEFIYTLSKN